MTVCPKPDSQPANKRNNMNGMSSCADESVDCPLCMEPLEVDDLNFYPCTCGYQVSVCCCCCRRRRRRQSAVNRHRRHRRVCVHICVERLMHFLINIHNINVMCLCPCFVCVFSCRFVASVGTASEPMRTNCVRHVARRIPKIPPILRRCRRSRYHQILIFGFHSFG